MPKVKCSIKLLSIALVLFWLHLEFVNCFAQGIRNQLSPLHEADLGVKVASNLNANSDKSNTKSAIPLVRTEKQSSSRSKEILLVDSSANLERSIVTDSILQFVSIPVLENALGDMNHDGTLSILDLLRLRDIVHGAGAPPSAYELTEGDVNGDHELDSIDVDRSYDILLKRSGPRYLVTSGGGKVIGNEGRTTFVLPPGTFTGPRLVSIENYSAEEMISDFGADISQMNNGAYFMAGAKLVVENSQLQDSVLPGGLAMSEKIPAGMIPDTTGNSGFFSVVSDHSGDGLPELNFMGDLHPDSMMTVMQYSLEPQILIDSIKIVGIDPSSGDPTPKPSSGIESGMTLGLFGRDWESTFSADYEAVWILGSDTLVMPVLRLITDDGSTYRACKGTIISVPEVASTIAAKLIIQCLPSNSVSNIVDVSVNPPASMVVPALRDSLSLIFHRFDTLFTAIASDSFVQALAPLAGFSFDSFLPNYRAKVAEFDSASDAELDFFELGRLYKMFTNSAFDAAYAEFSLPSNGRSALVANELTFGCRKTSGFSPDPHCIKRCNLVWEMLDATLRIDNSSCGACLLNPWCWTKCLIDLPKKPFDWVLDQIRKAAMWDCLTCCCPRDYYKTCNSIINSSVDLKTGNYDTKFVCIHYRWQVLPTSLQGSWKCISGCESEQDIFPNSCTISQPTISFEKSADRYPHATQAVSTDDFSGLIVSVNNSQIPWSHATIRRNNFGMIPFNLNSGLITFSGYFPRTGQFDPDIGNINVTDPLGRPTVAYLSFDPDTSEINHVLNVGVWNQDTVSSSRVRHIYRFTLPNSSIGRFVNVSLSSDKLLTFWIQRPDGSFASRDSLANCDIIERMAIVQSGSYNMTVTYGAYGGDGPFTVGVNYAPYPPIPQLCGNIPWDTLYSSYSPYVSTDASAVASSKTVNIQPGTTIDFYPGGNITGIGLLKGTATPAQKIHLRPGTGNFSPPITNNASGKQKLATEEGGKK